MQAAKAVLGVALCLAAVAAAGASGHMIQNGDGLKKMCQGADQIKALSMMCHSYLNGYIDAALHLGKGKRFCLGSGDKVRLPAMVVTWLDAHPAHLHKPAPEALDALLAESFPCRK